MSVQPDTDYAPGGAPFTGRKMLISMLVFFGVIITANMAMLTAALQSWGGLVVKNSYVASQNFERDAAAAAAQPISGWRIAVAADGPALSVTLRDAEGAPARLSALSAVIGRPTHERDDRTVEFAAVAPGLWRAEASLAPGRWRALLLAQGADGSQRRSVAFLLPAPKAPAARP